MSLGGLLCPREQREKLDKIKPIYGLIEMSFLCKSAKVSLTSFYPNKSSSKQMEKLESIFLYKPILLKRHDVTELFRCSNAWRSSSMNFLPSSYGYNQADTHAKAYQLIIANQWYELLFVLWCLFRGTNKRIDEVTFRTILLGCKSAFVQPFLTQNHSFPIYSQCCVVIIQASG